ncbi:DEAD/DEAH box helicase [Cyclobacterium plantarum]|uniref:DEAD/DEAH box helicase n=1 Tax=Cyclobacterium plantarum TaxID=2716263 RepID=A0ABX0HDH2_9BACT|nr:DEAD/DEAH box helicase [Cyclobacterium plantarum]NHE59939.1 DEAD/DEAH box helicase [Cyclobacterium plantarum]
MSLTKQLNLWIAQSESWQAFKDFDLPKDDRANYSFLPIFDDFYITLFCRAFDVLKQNKFSEEQKKDILAIGSGLVIFSLEGKRETFQGISFHDNMLYASGMYYLSDFSASALLLARKFNEADYESITDKFIIGFLARKINLDNEFGLQLQSFLSDGEDEQLKALEREINNQISLEENNAESYHSCILALAILKKFQRDNIWFDLLKYKDDREHWKPFVRYCIKRSVPFWSFFPSQKRALTSGVLSEQTISLQMPTSAGKTAISELVIYNSWKINPEHRTLYLAPFRSLAAELNQSMGTHLRRLGISTKSIYGGHLPSTDERGAIESVSLLVSTPEKMLAVEDALPEILDTFDTIICDEGHLLDDEQRGLSYELLLSRLKSHDKPGRRFVFISAIIPNISTINSWLGGSDETVIESDYRPTQLEYGFLEKATKGNYNLIVNPLSSYPQRYDLFKYLVSDSLKYKKEEELKSTTAIKSVSVATALRALPSGAVALFTTEKRGHRGVEDLCEEIIRQVNEHILVNNPLNYADAMLSTNLQEYFSEVFGQDYLLTRLVQVGALFHHGDLPQDVREVVENALRDEKIKLVVCNTTLAEGVNLPIRTMVLHSTQRYDGNALKEMSVRSLKNLVGRAGRAGKETKGLIIVPHARDKDIVKQLILDKGVEEVYGMLYNLVSDITGVLSRKGIKLTNEILDAQNEEFLQWLDSIDISLIDLLSEDIDPEDLEQAVGNMLSNTLSYHQATEDEKKTQEQIFQLRANKIRSYIEEGTFAEIRLSGTSLRSFKSITEIFDFENEVWTKEFNSPLDEDWINYLIIDGLLSSKEFQNALQQFNAWTMKEGNELSNEDVLKALRLWMEGNWYSQIAHDFNTEVYKIIRLINNLLAYNLQSLASSVIRIKIAKDKEYVPDSLIFNWPLFLQYGIDSNMKLFLYELGLTDRVAVLHLSKTLQNMVIEVENAKELAIAILEQEEIIIADLSDGIPSIAFNKVVRFIQLLKFR